MDNQRIAQSTLEQALKAYFDTYKDLTPLKSGHTNQNFLFTSGSHKYILRFYAIDPKTPRTAQTISTEINLINLFCSKGIPSASVIKNKNQEFLSSIDGRFFDVFEYIEGHKVYGELKAIHFEEVGNVMAKMHQITLNEVLQTDIRWPEGSFLNHVVEIVNENKNNLNSEDLQTADKIFNLQFSIPEYLIHGDFHFGNLIFRNDQLVAVLDFDHYRMGHLIDDITRSFVAEMAHTSSKEYWITQDFINSFWDGYLAKRELSDQEKELLIPYINLHYLNQLIRLTTQNPKKIPEFKQQVSALLEFSKNRLNI